MIRNRFTTITHRDCRKHNSSARKEILGMFFQSYPRKGYTGYWQSDNGRIVIRKKQERDGWQMLLDGRLVGNNQQTTFSTCVHANEWAVKKAL